MKIHLLHHGVSFHPQYLPFFSVLIKRQKLTKLGVNELAPTSHKTATCTHDVIKTHNSELRGQQEEAIHDE